MPGPPPRTVVRIVALMFTSLVVAGIVAVAGTAVVLPQCGWCHAAGAFAKATAASSHRSVSCANCHVGSSVAARAAFAFRESAHVAGGLIPAVASGSATVTDDRCLSCHKDVNSRVVSRSGLRIKHLTCTKGSTCVSCHSNTAHGTQTPWPTTYNMDQCLHCHGPDPKLSKCDLCHQGRSPAVRITTGPWVVTHGPNWRQTHGMGDEFTCPTCHPKGYCDKCHGPGLPHAPDFRTTHPVVAADPKAKCYSCHKQTFCTECHGGVQMPHALSFIKTHADTVRTGGTAPCERCHSKTDCTRCHEMHVHPGGTRMGSTPATAGP